MPQNNFSEKERIDAFAKALAVVLRRIAGFDSNTIPKDLPKPVKNKEVTTPKKK